MTADPTDLDLALPSGRVRVRTWGADEAPLLLCVHGISANLTAFTHLAEQLAGPRRRVAAFDLRGRGRSEVTLAGSYGLDAHTRDVFDVATALGADTFDVAGWSLGALIAMQAAVDDGARLRSVALIDHIGPAQAAALAPVREGFARLEAAVGSPAEYLDSVRAAGVIDHWTSFWDEHYTYELAELPDGMWQPTSSRAAAEEDLFQRWPRDWSDYWRALRMPTVAVRAAKPLNGVALIADDAVHALHTVNPAVRVVDAPDSNHFTCVTDPVTVAAIAQNLP
ncbi:alpha/beta hydrolase [Mycobacterium sp. 852013-51886_SCH5428379]|uniref:alpha/beta fold hydrolase n=1 Tax=Mycobacterium sp. 852013-51886_SCH5428379 TaxID=1834111 RepID=UPI000801415D|nr:alpha/beta fold hydrolase [Mycobacterium sp. 852013-51886_SCH5428379]OBB62006.1 alpha/beta hydrolase [Mycobacterium sp. 852013-51886_SCH5428379]